MEEIIERLKELQRIALSSCKKTLTIKEAASYAGISTKAIRNHLDEIGYYKPCKMIYVDREALDNWMRTNPVPSNAEIARQAAIYCDNH